MAISIGTGIQIETGITISTPIAAGSIAFGDRDSFVLATGVAAAGTTAVTYELWYYALSIPGNGITLDTRINGNDPLEGMVWAMYTVSPRYDIYGNHVVLTTSPFGPVLNTWTHLAVTIAAGAGANSAKFWVNGVNKGTFQFDTNQISTEVSLGGRATLGGIVGYISNFRYVKGVEVYTGTFTPPTSPLRTTQGAGANISAITAGQTQLLLNSANSSTYLSDSSSYNHTVTPTGTTSYSALNPFF